MCYGCRIEVQDARPLCSSVDKYRLQPLTSYKFPEKDQIAKVAETGERQIIKKKDMDEMFVKKSGE
jgi:hypothetical protein